jgi:hypothetical protein
MCVHRSPTRSPGLLACPRLARYGTVTLLAMSFVIGAGIAMLIAATLFVFGRPILHARHRRRHMLIIVCTCCQQMRDATLRSAPGNAPRHRWASVAGVTGHVAMTYGWPLPPELP